MAVPEQKSFITQWRLQPTKAKPAKVRTRIWAPKVRTGCQMCKQRKLKCGEEKPHCQRCFKARLECEYTNSKPILSEEEPELQFHDVSSSSPEEPLVLPSIWGDRLDQNEQRALLYFKERTAPILSAFAPGSAQFWTRIIPHMSLTNSTVRSAMIAVSSLQENVHYRGRVLQSTTLPERLYVKHLSQAIGALTASGRPPVRVVLLMSCLLFLACENLKQSPSTAQLHVQSGLKLLREWKEENGRTSYFQSYISDSMDDVIENSLEPIFARLEAQISLTKEPCESRLYFRHYDLNWKRPVVPDLFPDLFGARDSTHDIVQWSFYQTRLAGGPLLADSSAYRGLYSLYSQWDRTFAASFPQRDDRDWPAWTSAAALRVHSLALTMSMHAEALESTTYWDEHLDDVKWMLGVSSDIITSGLPPTDQQESLWLYDFCLTPPLLLTALNCRHPALRRKAITLMRIQHCWDNKEPLDACGTAKLCELVVKTEEAGLPGSLHTAEDIPAANRIRPLMVSLDEPGKISIFYDRVDESMVLQSTIDWDHWIPPGQDTLFIYPLGEMVKYGQFQGIIRPSRMSCLCKTYGAPDKDEWNMHM